MAVPGTPAILRSNGTSLAHNPPILLAILVFQGVLEFEKQSDTVHGSYFPTVG